MLPTESGFYLVKTWYQPEYVELIRQIDTKEMCLFHDGKKWSMERFFKQYMVSAWVKIPSPREMWYSLEFHHTNVR